MTGDGADSSLPAYRQARLTAVLPAFHPISAKPGCCRVVARHCLYLLPPSGETIHREDFVGIRSKRNEEAERGEVEITERGTLARDKSTAATKLHQLLQHTAAASDPMLSRFFTRPADEVGEQVISSDSDQRAITVEINDAHRHTHAR